MNTFAKSPTILDAIAEAFGDDLSPELILRTHTIDWAVLARLDEALREWAASARPPPKGTYELRPLVSLEHHGRVNWLQDIYYDEHTVFRALDSVKHHLLYCHSLAVDTALPALVRDTVARRATDYDTFRHARRVLWEPSWMRRELPGYFTLLLGLKPLIEAGVVTILPAHRFEGTYQQSVVPDRRSEVRGWLDTDESLSSDAFALAKTIDFFDVLPSEDMPNATEAPRAVRDYLLMGSHRERVAPPRTDDDAERMFAACLPEIIAAVLETVELVSVHEGNVDLYFPFRYYEQALATIVTHVNRIPGRLHDVELRSLRDLLAVPLPALENLDPTDIASVRGDEMAFERWRAALGKALERLRAIKLESLDPDAEAVRVIREELIDAAHDLGAELRRRRLRSLLSTGVRDLSVGAITGVGSAAMFNSLSKGTAAGIVALMGRMLFSIGSAVRADTGQSAWRRHYTLFGLFRDDPGQ